MIFPTYPISFSIELTYQCTNQCRQCSNVWNSKRTQNLGKWRRLLDRIAPPENRSKYSELIRISGGEPTLHPEFKDIVDYVDTFSIPYVIFTNGIWKDPEKLVKQLQKDNLLGILVSLHGSSYEQHNAFTHGSKRTFAEICKNIYLASESGIDVYTNTILTVDNITSIEKTIDLSQKLGAKFAVFNRLIIHSKNYSFPQNILREAVHRIEKLQNDGVKCRIGNCIPQCFIKNSSNGSNAGFEHCAVSPKGYIRPENTTNIICGNIFRNNIEEIWMSRSAMWFRTNISENCYLCKELPNCRGGIKTFNRETKRYQDPLMKDPIKNVDNPSLYVDQNAIPIPYYTIRKQPFGFIAARYNWSMPFSFDDGTILHAINGQNSLQELTEKYGCEVKRIVGLLYAENLIAFI